MTERRPPMAAPDIAGFTFQRELGSGGYSDVFLYEQSMPRRLVAIKVLLADRLDDAALQGVAAEANAMAAVSTHPYIVTIFHAELGGGGNPYLVMEYYPRPNFSVRARSERLPVAEVLRAGIQVASAVETAHRAGIIHRDIKPANILTSDYGRPGLTDFGIAALADDVAEAADGLSVPWAPPEVIDGQGTGGVAADVYSLGATVYSLLTGRSPFEIPGGENGTLALLERIHEGRLPPTGRGDVPDSLERLIRHAMAHRPDDRPASAAAFARALQDVEVQQRLAMTPLEVRDDSALPRPSGVADDGEGTRLKGPRVIHSQQPARPTPGPSANGVVTGVPSTPTDAATLRRTSIGASPTVAPSPVRPMPGPGAVQEDARSREPTPASAVAGPSPSKIRRARPVQLAAGALVVLLALVVVRLAVGSSGVDEPRPSNEVAVDGEVVEMVTVPAPGDVVVEPGVDGRVTATWSAPADMEDGDSFWVVPSGGAITDAAAQSVEEGTTAVLPPDTKCVDVRMVRNGVQSAAASNCG